MKGIEFRLQKNISQIESILIEPKVKPTLDIFYMTLTKFTIEGLKIAENIIGFISTQKHVPALFKKMLDKVIFALKHKPQNDEQSQEQTSRGKDEISDYLNCRKPINETKNLGQLNWFLEHMQKKQKDTTMFMQHISKAKRTNDLVKKIQTDQKSTQTQIAWISNIQFSKQSQLSISKLFTQVPQLQEYVDKKQKQIQVLRKQFSQITTQTNKKYLQVVQQNKKSQKMIQAISVDRNKKQKEYKHGNGNGNGSNGKKKKKASIIKRSTINIKEVKNKLGNLKEIGLPDLRSAVKIYQDDNAKDSMCSSVEKDKNELENRISCLQDAVNQDQNCQSNREVQKQTQDSKKQKQARKAGRNSKDEPIQVQNKQKSNKSRSSNKQEEQQKQRQRQKQKYIQKYRQKQMREQEQRVRKLGSLQMQKIQQDKQNISKNKRITQQRLNGKISLSEATSRVDIFVNSHGKTNGNSNSNTNQMAKVYNNSVHTLRSNQQKTIQQVLGLETHDNKQVDRKKILEDLQYKNRIKRDGQMPPFRQSQLTNLREDYDSKENKKVATHGRKDHLSYHDQKFQFKNHEQGFSEDKINFFSTTSNRFQPKNKPLLPKQSFQNLPSIHKNKMITSKSESDEKSDVYRDHLLEQALKCEDQGSEPNVTYEESSLLRKDMLIMNKINELQSNSRGNNIDKIRYYIEMAEKLHRKVCGNTCKHLDRFYKIIKNGHGWHNNRVAIHLPTRKIGFFS